MAKLKGIYQGEKRCAIEHTDPRNKILTDAPKDNHGKGESFSPTDLLAVGLGSCMLTVMAIALEKENLKFKGSDFEVEKTMTPSPRRISQLKLTISVRSNIPNERRAWIENIANNCPARLSLHPDIKLFVDFIYYRIL